jgi:hypothetical protein
MSRVGITIDATAKAVLVTSANFPYAACTRALRVHAFVIPGSPVPSSGTIQLDGTDLAPHPSRDLQHSEDVAVGVGGLVFG